MKRERFIIDSIIAGAGVWFYWLGWMTYAFMCGFALFALVVADYFFPDPLE